MSKCEMTPGRNCSPHEQASNRQPNVMPLKIGKQNNVAFGQTVGDTWIGATA